MFANLDRMTAFWMCHKIMHYSLLTMCPILGSLRTCSSNLSFILQLHFGYSCLLLPKNGLTDGQTRALNCSWKQEALSFVLPCLLQQLDITISSFDEEQNNSHNNDHYHITVSSSLIHSIKYKRLPSSAADPR